MCINVAFAFAKLNVYSLIESFFFFAKINKSNINIKINLWFNYSFNFNKIHMRVFKQTPYEGRCYCIGTKFQKYAYIAVHLETIC